MRLILAMLLLLATTLEPPTRVRLLLRDVHDRGVAGATLILRTSSGSLLQLLTDAEGQAISDGLAGDAVTLLAGQAADGRELVADSYPPGAGFRLALIAGATRAALLRLDGDRIVLDPDMIFSPDEPLVVPDAPAAPASRAPAREPSAGVPAPIVPAATELASASRAGGIWLLLAVALAGALLLTLALLIGLWRRRWLQTK